MAVKLRLTRVGKKKQPQYRIVAADTRSPRDGRFIEILGHYDPRSNPSKLKLNREKIDKWLADGALPSERVAKLIEIDANTPAEDTSGDEAPTTGTPASTASAVSTASTEATAGAADTTSEA